MFDMTAPTLRDRLRSGSTESHDRLDALVSGADLRQPEGYARFLAMNAAAFRALADAEVSGDFATMDVIRGLADAAAADLHCLGHTAPTTHSKPHAEALAIDYVVLGSRIGTKVLRRVWQGSSDPHVLSAGRYFALPDAMCDWRALCDRMKAMPGDDVKSSEVLKDVNDLFRLFHDCFTLASEEFAHA